MAITRYLLTDVADTLENSITTPFELTDYDDNGTLELAAGRSEEIGSVSYRVESGDFTITDSATDGDERYVYVGEDGITPGNGKAELLDTVPTYDPNKGGFYNGDQKAIFVMDRRTEDGVTQYFNKKHVGYVKGSAFTGDVTTPKGFSSKRNPKNSMYYRIEEITEYEPDPNQSNSEFCPLNHSESLIAITDGFNQGGINIGTDRIRAARLDAGGFTPVGTTLAIGEVGTVPRPQYAANNIVYHANQLAQTIKTYEFNTGSETWAEITPSLTSFASGASNFIVLEQDLIVVVGVEPQGGSSNTWPRTGIGIGELKVLENASGTWTQVGNTLNLPSGAGTEIAYMVAVSNKRFVINYRDYNGGTRESSVALYEWDGTDVTLVGTTITNGTSDVPGFGIGEMTLMNERQVAVRYNSTFLDTGALSTVRAIIEHSDSGIELKYIHKFKVEGGVNPVGSTRFPQVMFSRDLGVTSIGGPIILQQIKHTEMFEKFMVGSEVQF